METRIQKAIQTIIDHKDRIREVTSSGDEIFFQVLEHKFSVRRITPPFPPITERLHLELYIYPSPLPLETIVKLNATGEYALKGYKVVTFTQDEIGYERLLELWEILKSKDTKIDQIIDSILNLRKNLST